MISLRKSLSQFEEFEQRFRTVFDCYLSAIQSMERHTIPVNDDLVSEYRSSLKNLRRKLLGEASVEVLERSRTVLDRKLCEHSARASAVLKQRETEIKDIIKTLAEVTVTLTSNNEAHGSRLAGLTRELETIARLEDMSDIRCRLSAQIVELKEYAIEIRRSTQESTDHLRGELSLFKRRLVQAEALACTDPLTGVSNRLKGEQKLEEKIQSGRGFCILIFDLNRFKLINDRWGHQVGDAVLRIFARRLADNVRPNDTVCRWGGDEFLVILSACSFQDAISRSKELTERCEGAYDVSLRGRSFGIFVKTSVGMAEYKPGEDSETLFRRADEFLYREKRLLSAV